jgi:hypothetical protein
MFLLISGIITIFLLIALKPVGVAKTLGNGVITSVCYIGVMIFIVVTFTRSFRKSTK